MSELNRPLTRRPWLIEWDDDGNDGDATCWPWRIRGVCDFVDERATLQDARAIADLPAWIEAHDDWKARAEKAEAEVARLGELLEWVVRDFRACTPSAETQVSVGVALHEIERHGWGMGIGDRNE